MDLTDINKKTNDPLVFAFRGWQSPNSEVITNTVADLNIYVNGEKADQMPTTPGKYEVRIDYSNFVSKCDEIDVMMYISDFGYFSFNSEGYKIAGGLHGVGASVVNALSEWLEVEVRQNGNVYKQIYKFFAGFQRTICK